MKEYEKPEVEILQFGTEEVANTGDYIDPDAGGDL